MDELSELTKTLTKKLREESDEEEEGIKSGEFND